MHDPLKIAKRKGSALPYVLVPPADDLATLAEPTRLRGLSALSGAPVAHAPLTAVHDR